MTKVPTFRAVVDGAAVVAMLVASGVVFWMYLSGGPANRGREERGGLELAGRRVPISDVPALGSAAAPIGVVVFSDFECPYCAQFAERTQGELDGKFIQPGRIRLFFRHRPLQIHQNARGAALAAQCAAAEGQFWTAHDALFGLKGRLGAAAVAETVGAQMSDGWHQCMTQAEDASKLIDRDVALADELNIKSTPIFLVGMIQGSALVVTQTLSGSQPIERFTTAIEAASKTVAR